MNWNVFAQSTAGRARLGLAIGVVTIFVATSSARAQEAGCPLLTTLPVDSATAAQMRPDVVIHASATAREVRFDKQPSVSVQFRGCGIRDTVRVLERTNLPKPVAVGTTYSNVKIAVELYAYFDVDCILAQLAAIKPTGNPPAQTCRRK